MPKIGEITTSDKLGLLGRSREVWTACPICGRERWVRVRYKDNVCSSCGQSKFSTPQIRGRKLTRNGYWLVLLRPTDPFYCMAQKSGYVPEHRFIMAKHLGRPLEQWEAVHHKNGNKSDNRWKNLHLYPSKQHSQLHIEWKLISRIGQLEKRVTLLEAENELLKSQLGVRV